MLVPDQLRSAVKTPDRYEPAINATYAELSQHYGTAVVPARPRKPRDKAKVEGGVLIAQRWILASLRNRRFFSLEELNAAIGELLEKLNTRPFKKLEGCRRSAFETLERPALRPLPARRYEVGAWKLGVGVNLDHHLEYDDRFYSVPSELISQKVDVRASATVIEVWRDHRRITSHERSYGPKGTAVTKEEHRPRAHREWGAWPSERLVAWAQTKGPRTGEVAAAILARGPHPESGRRACLGLVRLGEQQGSERLEAACGRALAIGNPTYKSVKAILKSGLDKARLVEEMEPQRVTHENIRGGDYFDRGEGSQAVSREKIEARYLEEERYSIMNEPKPVAQPAHRHAPRSGGGEVRQEASSQVAESAPRVAVTEPLPVLLGRLQGLWSRPRSTERIGRREADKERGDDAHSIAEDGSRCASQHECLNDGEEAHLEGGSRQRYAVYGETMCRSEEEGMTSYQPRRGEA
jgi:hypothetical protein